MIKKFQTLKGFYDVLPERQRLWRIFEQEALKIWGEKVGSKISKNTEPKSVKNGILVIKTINPVWKQELQIQKTEIIKRLNNRLKKNIIKEIRFK